MKGDKIIHSYVSPPSDFEYISAAQIDHITSVLHPPLGYNLEPDAKFEEWIIPRLEVTMADQRTFLPPSITNIIIVDRISAPIGGRRALSAQQQNGPPIKAPRIRVCFWVKASRRLSTFTGLSKSHKWNEVASAECRRVGS